MEPEHWCARRRGHCAQAAPRVYAAAPGDHRAHRAASAAGGRGQYLLDVRPCQTHVPTLAQRKATHRLGEGTFHSSPERILGFELWRLLALPRRLERLVRGLGFHRELARRFRGRGTRLAGGADATGGPGKADADDGLARLTAPRRP